MIEAIFAFCMGLMTGLGNLLHLSYETVNVILFCFIEPIFTLVMIVLAILSFFLPVRKLGIWVFRIVVATVITALILGGCYFLFQGIIVLYGISTVNFLDMGYPTSFEMEQLFSKTVSWLNGAAKFFHTNYYVINIVVYILFMPLLCIASYVILRVKDRRERVQPSF